VLLAIKSSSVNPYLIDGNARLDVQAEPNAPYFSILIPFVTQVSDTHKATATPVTLE